MPTASECTRQMHECCRGHGLFISLLALGCFSFWQTSQLFAATFSLRSQTFVFRDNSSSVVYRDSNKTSKNVEHLVQETNLSALRDAEGSLNRRDLRSSGFLYIGFGDRRWCAESRKSIQSLRRANLGCRSKEPKDEAFCKIAFVSEQAQINTMRAECPEQFEAFVAVGLQGCPLAGIQDARAKKMCVRALGVAPFDYNVFMDMDTLILAPHVEEVFAVLRRGFHLAAAFECCAKGDLAESTLLHGWEMQTGVLGFSKTEKVKAHAKKAIEIYMNSVEGMHLSSGEQNAETQALAETSVRFFLLPPGFNMRFQTVSGFTDIPSSVVHHHFDDGKSLDDLIHEAKFFAMVLEQRGAVKQRGPHSLRAGLYRISLARRATGRRFLSVNEDGSFVDLWHETGPRQNWRLAPVQGFPPDVVSVRIDEDSGVNGSWLFLSSNHNGTAIDLRSELGPNQHWFVRAEGFGRAEDGRGELHSVRLCGDPVGPRAFFSSYSDGSVVELRSALGVNGLWRFEWSGS
mmetsp:Transcript_127815/g.409318  ORF Transcript_127815/g.409318 Transcript_127815/m.409318 type:complete len:516 (-) Transcript_127815:406-1953(-)